MGLRDVGLGRHIGSFGGVYGLEGILDWDLKSGKVFESA